MTAADLIEELKKLPAHQPIRLSINGAGGCCMEPECGFTQDSAEAELRDVSFQGNHIRLEGQ